jgi:hypothetical protein
MKLGSRLVIRSEILGPFIGETTKIYEKLLRLFKEMKE